MDDSHWYLLKHDDGALFGPVSFDQLKQWAVEAQISPLDKVSTDEHTWIKAPMVPDLEMDYLIEVSPDQFYGPTTLGAAREFVQAGEIHGNTTITNCRTGEDRVVNDFPELLTQPVSVPEESGPIVPLRTSIRVNLQQRIRELEEALMEERRAREIAEHLVEKLETKLEHITRAATR